MRTIVLLVLYCMSPVYINWVYMNIGTTVTESGERLLMVTDSFGFDPTLPIIGVVFFLRDLVQASGGRYLTAGGILAGTAVSYLVSPEVAIASGLAFLVSETIDMGIYTVLEHRKTAAILVSGVVASLLDSLTFLLVAFGTVETWDTQFAGKAITAILCAAGYKAWRSVRSI